MANQSLKDLGSAFGTVFERGGNVLTGHNNTVKDTGLGQSKYDFKNHAFPADIGGASSYTGHYVVINVNVQDKSNFGSVTGEGQSYNQEILTEERSKTDVLRYQLDQRWTLNGGISAGPKRSGTVPRYTTRVAESFALFMPPTLDFTDVHRYEPLSLTSLAGSVASGALGIAGAVIGGLTGGADGAAKGQSIAGRLSSGVGSVIEAGSKLAGTPINPKLEILYENTNQRSFVLEFLMAPESEQESKAMFEIIKRLRFHAAPELQVGIVDSFFYIPPSEFDLTFYHNGVENDRMPKINTCVLEQIDVSYAPQGVFAAFSTGYPVSARMTLRFTETEVAHKLRVLQGY